MSKEENSIRAETAFSLLNVNVTRVNAEELVILSCVHSTKNKPIRCPRRPTGYTSAREPRLNIWMIDADLSKSFRKKVSHTTITDVCASE